MQISHENFNIYCHFFTDEKTCPYDVECVFLHEDSAKCKYGDACERLYCMFKHEKKKEFEQSDIIEQDENDSVIENNSVQTEDYSSIHEVEV